MDSKLVFLLLSIIYICAPILESSADLSLLTPENQPQIIQSAEHIPVENENSLVSSKVSVGQEQKVDETGEGVDGGSKARWGVNEKAPVVSHGHAGRAPGGPEKEACRKLCESKSREFSDWNADDGCICLCPTWEQPCTLDCCTSDTCDAICAGGQCDKDKNCLCPCNLCDNPTAKTCPPSSGGGGKSGNSNLKKSRGLHSLFYR